MLRVTGKLVRLDQRDGTTVNRETGEASGWTLHIAKVLVQEQAVVEVTYMDGQNAPTEKVGAMVDWAVEVSLRPARAGSNRPGFVSIAYDQAWESASPAAAARVA